MYDQLIKVITFQLQPPNYVDKVRDGLLAEEREKNAKKQIGSAMKNMFSQNKKQRELEIQLQDAKSDAFKARLKAGF